MSTDSENPEITAGAFQAGDLVLLIDRKRRKYLITLQDGGEFHSHAGIIQHDDMIGQPEGSEFRTAQKGGVYLAIRPTLGDYILTMKRGATPIYPKDIGAILTHADIRPGARVVEAGIGSGALTIALLQAVGESGRVYSYENREDFAALAQGNVSEFLPAESANRLTVHVSDIYSDGINEDDVDRVVLDLPEPSRVIPHAREAMRPGGIFLAFVPTTLQLHRLWQQLDADPVFDLIDQFEIALRQWDAGPQTLRPAHRMVAHTGFITTARRLADPT
ncbi:MAG: tRNA (adenine-N1)-methyltransferase [Chloroflexi bacterium]|nr:tRNA (adenine-N1)-methyltransferase [Chloroflexota bacterium]